MRLLGTFADEKEAHLFCDFLSKKRELDASYEAYHDIDSGKHAVRVWVEEENEFKIASAWFERFKQAPQDFVLDGDAPLSAVHPMVEDIAPEVPSHKKRFRIKVAVRPKLGVAFTLTNFFLSLCILIFFWNGLQEVKVVQEHGPLAIEMGFTPLEQEMLFDYPHAFSALAQVLYSLPIQSAADVHTSTKR